MIDQPLNAYPSLGVAVMFPPEVTPISVAFVGVTLPPSTGFAFAVILYLVSSFDVHFA